MIGTTLSHYRIVDELGRGGMGIVYKAEDTKLDRTVALKILPGAALASEDDRARFYREAKAAAQLNHPHIAAVHEIDEAVPGGSPSDDLRPFIAMEYIDGKSLEDKAKEGPMALEEVVRLTTQIAQALEAAHEKNIVHRDIKSGNVMLTSKGQAKVLDFGLAKTAHSTMLTRMGSTLGTVAYMSPEQARGEDVDHRTDLWALGVLMYELIAGRLPFGGDYEQAVTYSILNEDPQPLTAIRTGVPMGLEWIVSKLLAKKADDRYQHASDLLVDLRTVDLTQPGLSRTASVKSMPAAQAAPSGKRNPLDLTGRMHPAAIVAVVIMAAVVGWLLGGPSSPEQSDRTFKKLSYPLPFDGPISIVDISNDGRYVAIATDIPRILDLTTGTIREYDLPAVYVHLDFSPSGNRLLLTTATEIQILTLDSGSVIKVLEPGEGGPRAEWTDEERIVYEEDAGIYLHSLATGETRPFVARDSLAGQYDLDWPTLLPDGKTVMGLAEYSSGANQIGFWDIDTGENEGYLALPGRRAQYVGSGHIVFVLDNDLVGLPFDLDQLEQAGSPVPIQALVQPEGVSVSQEGTLTHVGNEIGIVTNNQPKMPSLVNLRGATMDGFDLDAFPSAVYRSADVSPDGSKAAVVIEEDRDEQMEQETDIWILDFETNTRRRLTNDGNSDYPAWHPSGDSLYYVLREGAYNSLMIRAASGQGSVRLVTETAAPYVSDLAVSPNGKLAVYSRGIPTSFEAATDITYVDLTPGKEKSINEDFGLTDGPNGNPRHYAISPDNRYMAFEDQGGIYVQSLEDVDASPVELWENGRTLPKWSPDGSRLYVINVDRGGMSLPVRLDPSFSVVGAPTDHSELWWAFSPDFFDTTPTLNEFLFAFPDNEAESLSEDVAAFNGLDLSVFVNIEKALGASR